MPRHAAAPQPDQSPEPSTDPTFSAAAPVDPDPGERSRTRIVSPRTVRVLAYVVGLALLIGGAAAVKFGPSGSADPAAAARDDQRGSRSEVRPTVPVTPSATPTVDAAIGAAPNPSAVPTTPLARPATTPPARETTPKATAAAPPKVSAGCSAYSGNRLIACNLLPSFGFSTSEMAALDPMWNHESGWNASAENPSSGAYGIPQSLPGSKMATAGGDWRTNPATQIKWGLDYIKGRYGSPSSAWSFWQANGWY